jgi:hypothetical protein
MTRPTHPLFERLARLAVTAQGKAGYCTDGIL